MRARVWMLTQRFAEWQPSRAKALEQGLAHPSRLCSPLSILCFPVSNGSPYPRGKPNPPDGHTRSFIFWLCLPFEASSLLPSTPHTASTLFVLGYFWAFLSGIQYTPFLLLKALPCPDPTGQNPASSFRPSGNSLGASHRRDHSHCRWNSSAL